MFPDVEIAVGRALEAAELVAADHWGTQTPANLADVLPFVRVNRYGGLDDGVTDSAAVDVEWFALTRQAAIDAARAGHQFLTSGRHDITDGLLDRITTTVGVSERPWDNPRIRRFGASYTVDARRPALT